MAAVAVLGFALDDQRGAPTAVVDSQLDIVSKLASSIQGSTRNSVDELNRMVAARSAESTPAADTDLLTRVVGDATIWSGAAVVEITSRRPLAAVGAGLPFDLLPPVLPLDTTFAITTADGPTLFRSTDLDASRILLAAQPLTMRNLRLNPDARQGIFVLTSDGKSPLMQGVSAVDPVHLPVIFRGLVESGSRQSRQVTVTEWPDQQLVVSSAPLGDTGVTVASVVIADVTDGTSTSRGLLLGCTLLAMTVPTFLLMRVSLVRPVRALLKQGKADACGAVTARRQPLRVAEAYRIARALALASGTSLRALPRAWWRPTVLQGLTAAVVVALLWPAVAAATALTATDPSVPDQVIRDEESRVEAASSALGNVLDGGLQTVSRVSRSVGAPDSAGTTALLERELTGEGRFRGLYLVDPTGSVVNSAGRKALRTSRPLPGEIGIELDTSVSRLPVVYAFRVGEKGFSVVGEFDVDYLLGMMRQVEGRVRVVDGELRTILDSEGFRAFQTLQSTAAAQVAIEVLPGGTVGRAETSEGVPTLIAAASLTTPATVAHLEWAVVIEQDLAGLRLPELVERRWTLLIAGAAVGIVLLTAAWQFYIFVRPLQRLAGAADKISEGSFELPIPPQRHDDIGAVAMCLEICRQVRHTGSARFGGAIRLRGSEGNFTAVLPRTPPQPPADRAGPSSYDRAERG